MGTPFTSARSGLWDASDVDTWGQGAGVYPQTAADVVTIAAGHTVTYNKVSTVEMGAITVNGIFKASRTMSTKLTLGHVELTVSATGEMDWGKTGDVVGSAYVAEVLWNTTADNAKGIMVASGGKFYSLDNPAYYGSLDFSLTQANWTSGTTFYVTDNVSAKWSSGHELTVHKYVLGYLAANVALVTIASTPTWDGAKSTIVINEAFPTGTFNAGGRVEHLSRNVRFGKLGASTAIGNANTLRPRMTMFNTTANPYCEIGGCWTGFYGMHISYNAPISAVLRNGERFVNQGSNHIFTGKVLSCVCGTNACLGLDFRGVSYSSTHGVYSSIRGTISGSIYNNTHGLNYSYGLTVSTSAKIYGNAYGFNVTQSSDIQSGASVFHNTYGFYYSSTKMLGAVGYNGTTRAANSYDTFYSDIFLRNSSAQAAITVANRNVEHRNKNFYVQDYNGVLGAAYRFANMADMIRNNSTVRPGGQSSSIEVVPLSALTVAYKERIPGQEDWLELDVPAAQQTRTIYVKGEGWSANYPLNTELYLEAEYLDHASALTVATIASTQVLSDNTTWTALSVTFTPSQVGPVRYRVWFGKYAASCKVYIDAAIYNTAGYSYPFNWRDGEALLEQGETALLDSILASVQGIGTAGGAAINQDAATDNVLGAITGVTSGTTFLGTQSAGTYANTSNVNLAYHTITGTASGNTAMDIVYQFLTGSGTQPVQATWNGYVQSGNDTITLSAWRHDTGAWEALTTIVGTAGTTAQTKNITLFSRHRGTTAAEVGKVYLRLHCTGMTTPVVATDQIAVSYAVISRGTYSDGAAWINTNVSNTGTQSYVDGIPENPVSTIAAALTIAGQLGLKRFRVANGSNITLDAAFDKRSMLGHGYSLALGGQDISGAYLEGVEGLTGTGTCATAEAIITDCHLGTITIGEADFVRCHLQGTLTFSQNGVPYRLHDCAGISGAVVTFAGNTQVAVISKMAGNMSIAGMVAGNTLWIDGSGELTLAASCTGGTIYISGNIRLTNSGSGQTIYDAALYSDADTAEILTRIGVAGAGLTALGDTRLANLDAAITTRTKPADTQAAVTTLTNLPAAPTDWLTAAAVKADAVTKVQSGLATPTNITAGTITTVTNLTNAPTVGDLTATMKSSVTTAATAATPTVAAVTADVGITQTAADKVWGSATRSLTTFGTLVADTATAVWGAVTRTLTAASDTSGVTTLLARILGTLDTGTHKPQSGDAYARLGAPAGGSVSADIAAGTAATGAVSAKLGAPAGASVSADIAAVKVAAVAASAREQSVGPIKISSEQE